MAAIANWRLIISAFIATTVNEELPPPNQGMIDAWKMNWLSSFAIAAEKSWTYRGKSRPLPELTESKDIALRLCYMLQQL